MDQKQTMNVRQLLKYSPLAVAIALASGASQAAFLSGFGGSSSALSGSINTIDFESESEQTFSSLTIGDVTFSGEGGSSLVINSGSSGSLNTQGNSFNNNYGSTAAFRISFSDPVSQFAFNFGAANTVWNLSAYDQSDSLIEAHDFSQTNASSNAGDYFGLNASGISYFILTDTGGGDWILFDDLVYSAYTLSVQESSFNAGNTPALPAAIVIDNTPQLQALFSGLSTDQEISNGVSQTLPMLTGAGSMAARSTLYGINSTVGARQDANLGLSSGDPMLSDRHFWIKPFGTWSKQGNRNGVSGFDVDTGGLVLGLDGEINEAVRLGVAFAYANANVDSNSSTAPQSLDIDSYQLIGYGSRTLDADTDLTFQMDFGQNRNEGHRAIALNSSTAKSDYDSYSAHLGMGVNRSYTINEANRATATIKADYTWIKDEAYSESGAGLLNLSVDRNTTDALIAGVEGQLLHTLNTSTELNARLGLGYDLINDQVSISSSFAGAPSAQFTTDGIDPSPWIATGGFGLSHTTENGAEISANYDAEYRSDYLSHTASLKLNVAF